MKKSTDIIGFMAVVVFFVIALFLTQTYQADIKSHLDFGLAGMFFYVFLGITATVVAPVSTVPLIPVATSLWGPFLTGFLSIIAWTIGAVIAFLIARSYGRPVLKKYVDLNKVAKYENLFGTKYIFWQIIALRMLIPVDILSYAIGLFSTVKLTTYTTASAIGITPFAFVLAYMPNMDPTKQIYAGIIIAIVAYIGYNFFYKK